MADPVGIVTSALHAAHKVYDVLKTINDAPEEIRTLQLQTSMVRTFLPNVLQMVEHDQRRQQLSDPEQLQILLEQARQFQDAADTFLKNVSKKTIIDFKARIKYAIRASSGKELQAKFQSLLITLIAVTTSRTVNALTFVSPEVLSGNEDPTPATVLSTTQTSPHRAQYAPTSSPSPYDTDTAQTSSSRMLCEGSKVLPLSSPIRYVVAFHAIRRVRMLCFTHKWQAESIYNLIPEEWAKVLVDISDYQLLQSHAARQWTVTVCETVVRSAMEIDVRYVVAFHASGRVRMLGCVDQTDAVTIYNLIPEHWAKMLVTAPGGQILKTHGQAQWIQVCQSKVNSAPMTEIHYVVGFCKGNRVVLLGSREYEDAEVVYNQISSGSAKVLMELGENRVIKAHGTDLDVELCETTIRSAPLSTHSIQMSLSPVLPWYFVAFHASGQFRIVGAANLSDAEASYSSIPEKYAKVLMSMPDRQVLSSYGIERWTQDCAAIASSTPFPQVRYIVAFSHSDRVRVLASSNQDDAGAVFKHLSNECPKLLARIPGMQVLERWGETNWTTVHEAEVHSLALTAAFLAPLKLQRFLLAFHEGGRVRVFIATSRDDAVAGYAHISSHWCRTLLKVPHNEIMESSGGSHWVEVCQEKMRSISMIATRLAPTQLPYFLVAFHERDRVRILISVIWEDAETLYAQISERWSKVLMSTQSDQVMKSHGMPTWVKLCETEARAMATGSSTNG